MSSFINLLSQRVRRNREQAFRRKKLWLSTKNMNTSCLFLTSLQVLLSQTPMNNTFERTQTFHHLCQVWQKKQAPFLHDNRASLWFTRPTRGCLTVPTPTFNSFKLTYLPIWQARRQQVCIAVHPDKVKEGGARWPCPKMSKV